MQAEYMVEKIRVTWKAESMVWHGIKYTCFVSLSIKTMMELKPYGVLDKEPIKSIVIICQGRSGMDRGWRRPAGAWLLGLVLWHDSQVYTYSRMSLAMEGQ
jgi:hypothetical protein